MLKAGWREPVEVLTAFAEEPWAIGFLSDGSDERGRWSYVARCPDAVLRVDARDKVDPFSALATLLGKPSARLQDGPPFQGGLAGLATYEFGDRIESLGLKRQGDWPDLAVGYYPAVLAFDHQERCTLAVGRGQDHDAAMTRAKDALALMAAACREPHVGELSEAVVGSPPRAYRASVAEVVTRIAAGEIFQANIARSWTGRLVAGATPMDLLERLGHTSRAPFAAYFRLEDMAVVSNSPERFVQLDHQGQVEARPIKGTRPRGPCPELDAAMAYELQTSAKDRAENLMIVDLMRNDVARVCRPGSVKVPRLWVLETFVNVHHLVSTITGQLQDGLGAIDLLRAAFPPGSVTGAPKVQAMKTIARLEPPRGPYCGSMFWAGADGAFDSNVLIRTVACTLDNAGWKLEARAGAGIVADSDPLAECRETEAKISAILHAMTGTAS